MLISAIMVSKENLVTVNSNDNLSTALTKIKENNFLSIPVVDNKKFVGVIAKGKIFEGFFGACGNTDEYLKDRLVNEFIYTDIPVISPVDQVEKAAVVLEKCNVPFVAVVNNTGEFEGIITHYNIFKAFSSALGINRGKRLDVVTHEMKGQIEKLSEAINKNGGEILSFVVLDPNVKTGIKEIVARIETDDFERIVKAVKTAGFKVM